MKAPCDKLVYTEELFLECPQTGEKLDLYEAAYLSKKGRVKVGDGEGRQLDWVSLILMASRHEPRSWVMFSVYYDLREKGRVPKLGPLPEAFTLYKSGAPRSLVVVLEETFRSP